MGEEAGIWDEMNGCIESEAENLNRKLRNISETSESQRYSSD